MPGAPPQVLGVINLRGELRAVLDLGQMLGSTDRGDGDSAFVLMLRNRRPGSGGRGIGFKVGPVEEICEIRPDELTLPEQGQRGQRLKSGTLMLLDLEKVLAESLSKKELLET